MSVEDKFPNLAGSDHKITSASSPSYNCIAWAADDTEKWWWPDENQCAYWPPNVPRSTTIESFIAAFRSLGYERCPGAEYEPWLEKVAIYIDAAGNPQHAARQLPNRLWTSKLGRSIDLEHDLEALCGPYYGTASIFMSRPIAPSFSH
jgi:hypothetical protein